VDVREKKPPKWITGKPDLLTASQSLHDSDGPEAQTTTVFMQTPAAEKEKPHRSEVFNKALGHTIQQTTLG
jgi:hypothetical protein